MAGYTMGCQSYFGLSINIPDVRLRCLVLDIRMKFFQDFKVVKTQAYEYAIITMSVPTARCLLQAGIGVKTGQR